MKNLNRTSLTIVFPWGKLSNEELLLSQLKRFEKFSKKQAILESNITQLLFRLFGYRNEGELPVAAVCGLADGLPVTEGYWMRADPVVLQPDLAGIYMLESSRLPLSLEDASRLIEEINPLLETSSEQFFIPHPLRWYLKNNQVYNLITHEPQLLVGKEISSYMLKGEGQDKWRRLITEIQMQFFQSKINQQLQQESHPPISSVWFWGSGILPDKSSIRPWNKIWSNNLIAKGLAKLNEIPCLPLTSDIENLVSKFDVNNSGEYLIVFDAMDIDNNYEPSLIMEVFSSAWQALRKGLINKLVLYQGDGYENIIYSRDVIGWRYWFKLFF